MFRIVYTHTYAGRKYSLEVFLPGRTLLRSSNAMETLLMKKQKVDRRKLQDFKEDGLNSPKGIQVYEVSM